MSSTQNGQYPRSQAAQRVSTWCAWRRPQPAQVLCPAPSQYGTRSTFAFTFFAALFRALRTATTGREMPESYQSGLLVVGCWFARSEIILQNPYFIPDSHAVELYAAAVKRGVRVKLMLPTAGTSDFPVVQHASHFY